MRRVQVIFKFDVPDESGTDGEVRQNVFEEVVGTLQHYHAEEKLRLFEDAGRDHRLVAKALDEHYKRWGDILGNCDYEIEIIE